MRKAPPSHDKSYLDDDSFFPVMLPAAIAANPAINERTAVLNGRILQNPQLSPVAAESSELASARAAASAADRDFELSISAAVSSRYSLITKPLLPVRSENSPFSDRCFTRMRTRLLNIVITPIDVRTISPSVRKSAAGINSPAISDKRIDNPSTAALIRLITAADVIGIFMPLLQYAAATRYVSKLTMNARMISCSK